MGGNAFHQILPATSFPRIPPTVYSSLKARLIPLFQSIYVHIAVPFEAPEKLDYGDLDFVVAGPKCSELGDHEEVKRALGAKFCILLEGNRTSNFAVPIGQEDWEIGDDKFYQVDVHVCADEEEWGRVVFFHGYGDLGMIMGLIATNNGFALGTKGLKVRNKLLHSDESVVYWVDPGSAAPALSSIIFASRYHAFPGALDRRMGTRLQHEDRRIQMGGWL
jgi:hypothetical protein